MKHSMIRMALAAGVAALVLAGCGGGGGGGGPAGNGPDTPPSSEVPSSALTSVQALVDYLDEVIASMTSNTTEPILLGDAVLPTSETLEPLR